MRVAVDSDTGPSRHKESWFWISRVDFHASEHFGFLPPRNSKKSAGCKVEAVLGKNCLRMVCANRLWSRCALLPVLSWLILNTQTTVSLLLPYMASAGTQHHLLIGMFAGLARRRRRDEGAALISAASGFPGRTAGGALPSLSSSESPST